MSQNSETKIYSTLNMYIELHSGKSKKKSELIENGTFPVYGGNGVMGYSNEYFIEKETIVIGRVGANCGIVHKAPAKSWITDNALFCTLKRDINFDYLFYFLKFLNLHSLAKQNAQPVINQTNIGSTKTNFPLKTIQKQIVAKLDHILGELEVRKKEIISLIEQNKERIDFFEKNWMSYVIDREIEKHPQRNEWVETSLGETFEEFNQKWLPSTTNKIVNYIGLENIESNTGKLVNFTPIESSKIKSSKTIFTKNQVLYGKLRPYLNKVHLPEFDGICSTDILSLTPKSNIDRQFLAYFLRSQLVLSHVNKSVYGTKMPRTKIQVLQEFLIQLPDLPIQKQIIQNIKSAEEKFQSQKKQFENIKQNYDSKIKYINHIQSSVLDSAFSGKLVQ